MASNNAKVRVEDIIRLNNEPCNIKSLGVVESVLPWAGLYYQ